MFSFALLSPHYMKLASRDNWGNLKVPRLDVVAAAAAAAGGSPAEAGGKWLPVPNITKPAEYASLQALMIDGLPIGDAANFTIEVSYLSLLYSPWQR
jgi:hypothetical protein